MKILRAVVDQRLIWRYHWRELVIESVMLRIIFFRGLILLISIACLEGCIIIPIPIPDRTGDINISGRIGDCETGRAISNASVKIVVPEWKGQKIPSFTSQQITDKEGYFSVTRKGRFRPLRYWAEPSPSSQSVSYEVEVMHPNYQILRKEISKSIPWHADDAISWDFENEEFCLSANK